MLFQQAPEVQNHGLVRDPATDQVDPGKAAKEGVSTRISTIRDSTAAWPPAGPGQEEARSRLPLALGLLVIHKNQAEGDGIPIRLKSRTDA